MVPLGDSHTAGQGSLASPIPKSRVVQSQHTLLQLELLNTGLIGSDGGALDTNTILLDGLSGLDGDLVVGLITVLKTLQENVSRR